MAGQPRRKRGTGHRMPLVAVAACVQYKRVLCCRGLGDGFARDGDELRLAVRMEELTPFEQARALAASNAAQGKIKAAQYVRANPGQVCPAAWEEGADTLAPSLDLVGKI